MSEFNEYTFIEGLKENFITDLKNGNVSDIRDYINSSVENEVIYYYNCFEIIQELNITDWKDLSNEFGEITNISFLAYAALNEYVNENLDYEELEKIQELYERYNEIEEEISSLDQEEEQEDIKEYEEEKQEVIEELKELGFEL